MRSVSQKIFPLLCSLSLPTSTQNNSNKVEWGDEGGGGGVFYDLSLNPLR